MIKNAKENTNENAQSGKGIAVNFKENGDYYNYQVIRIYKWKGGSFTTNKEILLSNIDKVHTTQMGIIRIKKNLRIEVDDIVEYCKKKVLNPKSNIYKAGKNWYIEIDNIKITINSYSYTIITAHIINNYN